MQESPTIVILLGLPGSGKGTQAKLLAEKFGWEVFSSGNLLKELKEDPSILGQKVKTEYENGRLSPDWLVSYLFVKDFVARKQSGMVIEGFPRSLAQAQLADEVLSWLNQPYKVLYLEVSEKEALERQISRAKVEHRPDSDAPEKVQKRFETYRTFTEPVVAFFKEKGTLVTINGEQSPEKIAEDIRAALHLS